MAGDLKLKQEETIRKDNTIIFFEYGTIWANFNQYKLTPDLIEKLDSEEIYIEDINLTELELIDNAGIANSEGAIFELKEVYFPDLEKTAIDVKNTEVIRQELDDSLLIFEDFGIYATVKEYHLTDDLMSKILAKEIDIKDIDVSKLELVYNESIYDDPCALEKLKEMYFPTGKFDSTECVAVDLTNKSVDDLLIEDDFPIEVFSEEPSAFDKVNKLKDIISFKEAEYSLSILNDVKEIISEILFVIGKDFIIINENNLKDTSFNIDKVTRPIKVNKDVIIFKNIYLGEFTIPLQELSLPVLIELSKVI